MIDKVFDHRRDGFFVEVGAHDGVTYSNTVRLEREYGWSGVCIEPNPQTFPKCLESRAAECINAAVAECGGVMTFVVRKDPTWSGLKRTLEASDAVKAAEIAKTDVRVVTLGEVLRERGIYHVDYLSVDAEGGDLNVIRGINFDEVTIDCITIEVRADSAEKIRGYLNGKGYKRVAHIGADDVFVRDA